MNLPPLASCPGLPACDERLCDDHKTVERWARERHELLEYAWTIIANAGGGDWGKETKDWQDAAAKFRNQYHDAIKGAP